MSFFTLSSLFSIKLKSATVVDENILGSNVVPVSIDRYLLTVASMVSLVVTAFVSLISTWVDLIGTSLPAVPVANPVRSISFTWVSVVTVPPEFLTPPLTIKAYASSSDRLIVCIKTSLELAEVTPVISATCSVQGLFSSQCFMCDNPFS